MTFRKKKTKTLTELFGFKDEELATPEHDEIMIALSNRKKLTEVLIKMDLLRNPIIRLVCPHREHHYSYKGCDTWSACHEDSALTNVIRDTREQMGFRRDQCCFSWDKLEQNKACPVNKKIFDEYQKIRACQPEQSLPDLVARTLKVELEYLVEKRTGFVVGFVDMKVVRRGALIRTDFLRYDLEGPAEFFIEIKPKIRSVGETLRQMKFYANYLKTHTPILVTKTKGLKNLFEGQGIRVYEWVDEVEDQSITEGT